MSAVAYRDHRFLDRLRSLPLLNQRLAQIRQPCLEHLAAVGDILRHHQHKLVAGALGQHERVRIDRRLVFLDCVAGAVHIRRARIILQLQAGFGRRKRIKLGQWRGIAVNDGLELGAKFIRILFVALRLEVHVRNLLTRTSLDLHAADIDRRRKGRLAINRIGRLSLIRLKRLIRILRTVLRAFALRRGGRLFEREIRYLLRAAGQITKLLDRSALGRVTLLRRLRNAAADFDLASIWRVSLNHQYKFQFRDEWLYCRALRKA